jgi:hypothetical protein
MSRNSQSFAGARGRRITNGFRFGLGAKTTRPGLMTAGLAGSLDLRLIRLGGGA